MKNKFLELKSFRTLYIVFKACNVEPLKILNIKESLMKMRGNDNFSLLVVSLDRRELLSPIDNIFFDKVIPHPTGDWNGNRESWKKVLDKFLFTPKEDDSDKALSLECAQWK